MLAIFGSLDMSENQIVDYLRAIESQPRDGDDGQARHGVFDLRLDSHHRRPHRHRQVPEPLRQQCGGGGHSRGHQDGEERRGGQNIVRV